MTVEEYFADKTFLSVLRGNIKDVEKSAIFVDRIKSNPFKTLHKKGELTMDALKYHFTSILMKCSKLSSGERNAVAVLVQDAINKSDKIRKDESR